MLSATDDNDRSIKQDTLTPANCDTLKELFELIKLFYDLLLR